MKVSASDNVGTKPSQPVLLRRTPHCAIHHSSFSVGGVSFELSGDSGQHVYTGDEIRQFQVTCSAAVIAIEINWADTLPANRGKQVFDSGATWKLFRNEGESIFEFVTPRLGARPYRQMRVDQSLTHAEIFLNRSVLGNSGISPLEYPVCELLITNYLARYGLGVEVHGCGLVDRESGGHLFLGHSGAGKSTTARLWETFRDPEILSDDRIILRVHNGEVWMYGTPWHGEAAFASPGKARLNRIHLLRHGTRNSFRALPNGQAVAEIFARSFPPFHSPQGLQCTIEFLQLALSTIPCYEFQFVPDRSAVKAVLDFQRSQLQ
ncbi:MAG TPA: hypothetical protein VH596_11060 [Terriglobales bacterium]